MGAPEKQPFKAAVYIKTYRERTIWFSVAESCFIAKSKRAGEQDLAADRLQDMERAIDTKDAPWSPELQIMVGDPDAPIMFGPYTARFNQWERRWQWRKSGRWQYIVADALVFAYVPDVILTAKRLRDEGEAIIVLARECAVRRDELSTAWAELLTSLAVPDVGPAEGTR